MEQKSKDQHHQGGHGHGGQHSGGMGGERGGTLHDVGSAQSGMAGRGGMGGHEPAKDHEARGPGAIDAGEKLDLSDEAAQVQQSAQREGMGHHRHNNRGDDPG